MCVSYIYSTLPNGGLDSICSVGDGNRITDWINTHWPGGFLVGYNAVSKAFYDYSCKRSANDLNKWINGVREVCSAFRKCAIVAISARMYSLTFVRDGVRVSVSVKYNSYNNIIIEPTDESKRTQCRLAIHGTRPGQNDIRGLRIVNVQRQHAQYR